MTPGRGRAIFPFSTPQMACAHARRSPRPFLPALCTDFIERTVTAYPRNTGTAGCSGMRRARKMMEIERCGGGGSKSSGGLEPRPVGAQIPTLAGTAHRNRLDGGVDGHAGVALHLPALVVRRLRTKRRDVATGRAALRAARPPISVRRGCSEVPVARERQPVSSPARPAHEHERRGALSIERDGPWPCLPGHAPLNDEGE